MEGREGKCDVTLLREPILPGFKVSRTVLEEKEDESIAG
mgnify:FL=1